MERRSGLGYTPIHVTAHYDRVGVARLLLEAGVNPDEEDLQVSRFLQLRPSKFLPFPVTHYILRVFQKNRQIIERCKLALLDCFWRLELILTKETSK